MQEQLISLETAKLAKEKGFNVYTLYYYDSFGDIGSGDNGRIEWNNSKILTAAPTQSLLQRWLREKHNIHVWLIPAEIDKTYRAYIGYGIKLDLIESLFTKSFETYEKALEAGLLEALKLIK